MNIWYNGQPSNKETYEKRALTPKALFNKGINCQMSAERRRKKHTRHAANVIARRMQE